MTPTRVSRNGLSVAEQDSSTALQSRRLPSLLGYRDGPDADDGR
jgi:hypothetical protein